MAATVEIDEQNGKSSSAALTHNIGSSNMGNSDSANLNPVSSPISPGNNSFEKWQLVHVTDMGSSSKINNLQVWRSGALGANASHVTNARTGGYGGAPAYTNPTAATSAIATQSMPTGSPGSANLGIGGSLDGAITSPGYSDFLVHQIQTSKTALAGSTTTLNFQYDETA